ncbi:LysM domain-containing protein [Colletotrichum truncatum]|uniref:LysM domain-containing protein n=1 Tax=Colletotrichum truncatum TaxID=5467 RepID=A0ACC3YRX0_COLTU|nr:LysM domain-containing protein [Colletotrichum truncatum]KAF6789955.1 LysM domain-containing protein [Colletotrichum truncatum]
MSRFSRYDTDDERLPEGMQRVGYDADTQTYTYRDSDGSYWEGAPGNEYGHLTQVSGGGHASRHARQPVIDPDTRGRLWEEERKNWRQGWQPLLNFFLIIGLFLMLLTWWLYRTPSEELPQCGGQAVPYKISKGDTCWAIAEEHKMSVEDLVKANDGLNCDKLRPGSSICVPSII